MKKKCVSSSVNGRKSVGARQTGSDAKWKWRRLNDGELLKKKRRDYGY